MEGARFDIALPLTLPFARINDLASSQLPTTIRRADQGIEATIRSVKVSALEEGRLLLAVEGKLSETRWLFGKVVEGTLYINATPKLDATRRVISLESVEVDVRSGQFLGATELLAKAAAPLLEQWIVNNVTPVLASIDRTSAMMSPVSLR